MNGYVEKHVITLSSLEIGLIKAALATYENCVKANNFKAGITRGAILDTIERLASKLDIQEHN